MVDTPQGRRSTAHKWAAIVEAGRPYPDLDALLRAADEAIASLSEDEVVEALAFDAEAMPHAEDSREALRRLTRARLRNLVSPA